MILRVRALELDNERLNNLLKLTPQAPYIPGPATAVDTMSDDDLGEQTFQNAQEWARRGLAAQEAVNKILNMSKDIQRDQYLEGISKRK